MNCCNDYGHCTRGPDCPAHGGTITYDANGLTVTEWPPLVTTNSDGSNPHDAPAPNLPFDWIDELRTLAPWAAALVTLSCTLGLLAGYHFGR